MEPLEKQRKVEESDLKEILLNMQSSLLSKLNTIEEKIQTVSYKYQFLEGRMENILLEIEQSNFKDDPNPSTVNVDPSIPKGLTTNCEGTYPGGSWLGNPRDKDLCVRCCINPVDLQMINDNCSTPEKMALTLLDHLFDRETQANSNISGTGKHGKEQLDPLKIFGIKCHLMYKFGLNHKAWLRIRANIDSKCRTAFRRKQKGLPLVVKSCRDQRSSCIPKSPNTSLSNGDYLSDSSLLEVSQSESLLVPKTESHILEFSDEQELTHILPLKLDTEGYSLTFTDSLETQIIHTEHGDIQVIQATVEQLEQLKQSHHIEVLPPADMWTAEGIDNTDFPPT